MSTVGILRQIEILMVTGSLLACGCALLLAVLASLSALPWLRERRNFLIGLGGLLPAGILAALTLLMVDNFTYTVFKFGIVSTAGVTRGLYAAGFIAVVVLWYRYILRKIADLSQGQSSRRLQKRVACGLLAGMVIFSSLVLFDPDQVDLTAGAGSQKAQKLPNIIFITADGLDATHLSAYGYKRETTPFIEQLLSTSLVAENNFPNVGRTAGSIISTYTGKSATSTGVLTHQNVLRGVDAYQHLPGILHLQGYFTEQIAYPIFVDAYRQNMINAFDVANGQKASVSLYLKKINEYIPYDYAYFLYDTANRLADRLRHIFYQKIMINYFAQLTQDEVSIDDRQKVKEILEGVSTSRQPVFIHAHLMATHGAHFSPISKVFSGYRKETDPHFLWDVDLYDDTILDFDGQIKHIIDWLKERDLYDNTILIIGSDHGQQFYSTKRIPLIIHFPHGEYAGKIQVNTQNIDIAPTILDYLGLNIPRYMQGQSLLRLGNVQRPILAYSTEIESDVKLTMTPDVRALVRNYAPFRFASLVHCQRWYRLDLITRQWTTGDVEGHTAPCAVDSLLTNEQAFNWIIEDLEANAYKTDSLKNPPPDFTP
jgi:arylsulfatase A-like enzyme